MGHNYLRTLPYEVGKLFNIIILVLVGNPLTKEIMALYSEPNGTQKLLTYMLDNLHGEFYRFCMYLSSVSCDSSVGKGSFIIPASILTSATNKLFNLCPDLYSAAVLCSRIL